MQGSQSDIKRQSTPRESCIPIGKSALFSREIGEGQPIIVLHGGPDFDHSYLVPDLDRLSDSFHLIYYDQRGRGRSADHVQPDEVSIATEMDDLNTVRRHFGLDSAVMLGHSWGAILALEYAIRQPDRVSHLILMNPAPASTDGVMLVRKEHQARAPDDIDALNAASSTAAYRQGDPDAVAAKYRIQYKAGIRRLEDLERVLASLRDSFTKDGILKARQIEERLMNETWLSGDYDLLPKLEKLSIPTLVIYGDHDFIPSECVVAIARALPKAHLVTLPECGHFSYLECPDAVRKEILEFLRATPERTAARSTGGGGNELPNPRLEPTGLADGSPASPLGTPGV